MDRHLINHRLTLISFVESHLMYRLVSFSSMYVSAHNFLFFSFVCLLPSIIDDSFVFEIFQRCHHVGSQWPPRQFFQWPRRKKIITNSTLMFISIFGSFYDSRVFFHRIKGTVHSSNILAKS